MAWVCNLTVFVNRLPNHLIGNKAITLPNYIKNKQCLIVLDKDGKSNSSYKDNLCFFRALALWKGVPQNPTSIFEAAARELFHTLVGGDSFSFEGIQLQDLPGLEVKLEMNINVYELIK